MTDKPLILVNLGSTASTDASDVRRYLNQFLMDPHVIDVPWPLRRLIVSLVLRKRPEQTAEAYRSIWWEEGSPLTVISERLQRKMAEIWNAPVELAMRYGEPSIDGVLKNLAQRGIQQAILAPLYPQFAMSTVTTVVEEARQAIKKNNLSIELEVMPCFYDQPEYVTALAASAEPYLAQSYDHLLLSYHGLPERHIHKADPTNQHCLANGDCCQQAKGDVLTNCYRAQCVQTSECLISELGVPEENWSMAFQSRLGRDKWIEPYTDVMLQDLAEQGVKQLMVMCPAFTADCVETLEEIAMQGRDTFRAAGGDELTLIPCLNDQPLWVDALAQLCRRLPRKTISA